MQRRWKGLSTLAALAIALTLAGCGDDSNDNQTIIIGATPTPVDGHTATPARTETPLPGTTPTVTVTVAQPTATTAGPAPTATPVVGGCRAGDQIVVTESLDKTFGGATVDLKYPASANIPGTGGTPDVTQRVQFAVSGGLTSVNDHGSNGGAMDDTLTLSVVSSNDNPAGTFATVTFDCVTDQAPPTVGDFTCTVTGASDSTGTPITGVNCTLGVTGP